MAESKYSLVRKELFNILDLATCDDTLFNDGINLEIEACAKKALELLDTKKTYFVVVEDWSYDGLSGISVVGLYDTRNQARKALEKRAEKEKASGNFDGFNQFVKVLDSFSTWVDGWYEDNHYTVKIIEETLQ